jgi:putative membrane protein
VQKRLHNINIVIYIYNSESMKTVILCIDRDDDIGAKGGVEGPIIGREENVRAALALGLADPEDADTNTLLAAIKIYDEMVKEGENVELATICGDVEVGYKSDRILRRQLEEVIEIVNPNHAILVTNGAEDEYIFPMVSSRLKIDHVHDVYVKQSRRLESWYYYIVKVARDSKLRRKVIVPVALAFMLIGLFYLIPAIQYIIDQDAEVGPVTDYALPTLSLLIGNYILWRAYMVGDAIAMGFRKTRESIYAGDLSLAFYVATTLLVVTGIVKGMDRATMDLLPQDDEVFNRILLFLDIAIPWFGVAAVVLELRRAVNALILRDAIPASFWTVTVSLVGLAFLAMAGTNYLERLQKLPMAPSDEIIFIEGATGVCVLLASYIQQRRSKVDITSVRDRWRR